MFSDYSNLINTRMLICYTRLVLLLQGMAQFCDQLLTSYDGRPASGKILGSSMSVGLVAKKFWNKLVHVQQTAQQLQFEVGILFHVMLYMQSLCIIPENIHTPPPPSPTEGTGKFWLGEGVLKGQTILRKV